MSSWSHLCNLRVDNFGVIGWQPRTSSLKFGVDLAEIKGDLENWGIPHGPCLKGAVCNSWPGVAKFGWLVGTPGAQVSNFIKIKLNWQRFREIEALCDLWHTQNRQTDIIGPWAGHFVQLKITRFLIFSLTYFFRSVKCWATILHSFQYFIIFFSWHFEPKIRNAISILFLYQRFTNNSGSDSKITYSH